MYCQRRVLFGFGFVCPSIPKKHQDVGEFCDERCGNHKEFVARNCFFGVLRKEKHITHQTSRQQSPLPSSNADPWKRWQTHWVWANFSATNPLGHPK